MLSRLDELRDDVKTLDDKVEEIRLEVAMLKVKSGLWGALAGLIPVAIVLGLGGS